MIGGWDPRLLYCYHVGRIRCFLCWLLCDHPIAQILAFIGYMQTPVKALFHGGLLGPRHLFDDKTKEQLKALYQTLNPFVLRKHMEEDLKAIFKTL